MSELLPATPSRRTVLSAAALFGGASLTGVGGYAPAVAAPRLSTLYLTSTAARTYRNTVQHTEGGVRYTNHATAIAISPALDRLFAGGDYTSLNGLYVTDLATSTLSSSPPEARIGRVSALHMADGVLYIGTRGGGVHSYTLAGDPQNPASYRRLVPGTVDSQGNSPVRTSSIVTTHGHILYGTRHDDLNAGTLSIIDRSTGVVTSQPSPVAGTNVISLATDGWRIFGTAKPLDGTASGTVFGIESDTGEPLWQSPVPSGHRGLGDVVLFRGLHVATLTSVLHINQFDGEWTGSLFVRGNTASSTISDAKLVPQATTTRLIHRAEGSISVISLPTRRVCEAYDEGGEAAHHPWTITSDAAGNVWKVWGENTVHQMAFDNMRPGHDQLHGYHPYQGPSVSPFVDVTTTHAFYDEISWLSDTGVSRGWATARGKEFRPAAKVTRDVMAAFLHRLAGSPVFSAPQDSPFLDVPTDHVFYNEIAWLAHRGISGGWSVVGGKEFRPNEPVLRDQMAAFMYRLVRPSFQAPEVAPFIDVPGGRDFTKEIAWLAARGISGGWSVVGGKEFRPYAPVLRDQMAAFMYRLAATSL